MESFSISCQKILKFHCKIIIPLHLHPFKYLAWKRFDRSNFLISGPGLTTNALIDAEIVQVFLCYRRFSHESRYGTGQKNAPLPTKRKSSYNISPCDSICWLRNNNSNMFSIKAIKDCKLLVIILWLLLPTTTKVIVPKKQKRGNQFLYFVKNKNIVKK